MSGIYYQNYVALNNDRDQCAYVVEILLLQYTCMKPIFEQFKCSWDFKVTFNKSIIHIKFLLSEHKYSAVQPCNFPDHMGILDRTPWYTFRIRIVYW